MAPAQVYNLRVARETEAMGRIGRRYAADGRVHLPNPHAARDAAMLGNRITPQLLSDHLARRNEGWRADWADLADELARNDLHLQSQLRLAKDTVAETPFRLALPEGATGAAADKALAACRALWAHWQRAGLGDWLREIVAAEYYGLSAHELVWLQDGAEVVPTALARLLERRLSYACAPDDPDPWAPRLYDPEDLASAGTYGTKLADYGPDKVLVHEPYVLGGVRTAEGLFSAIVWYAVFTVWTWRDLMALNEMIGRPPVVAYYAAGGARQGRENEFTGARPATTEEIDAGTTAVFRLTGSLRAVLPDTVRLEALKFPIPTGEPVQLLTEARANALISKAIHGVDSVSDLKPGARASVEVQERATNTPWRVRCNYAARQLSKVFAAYVRANPGTFGADCPLPYLEPDVEPAVDRLLTAQGIRESRALGLKIPRAWAYKALQIPAPAPGEDVLDPAPAPTPAPVPGGTGDGDPPSGDPPPEPREPTDA